MAAKSGIKIDYPTTESGMLAAAIEEARERGDHEWAAMLEGKHAARGGKVQAEITEASGSTFNGGPVNGHAKAAPKRVLSDAQLKFLISLTLRKTGCDVTLPKHAILLEALKALSPKKAYDRTQELLAMDDYAVAQEATRAAGHEPIPSDRPNGKRQPVHYPTIPAGWYRIEEVNYKVSQPTKGNWVGWTFIEDEENNKYRGDAAKELLDLIATDPFKFATDYGHATSVCGCCLTPLEHPASVELGIGPICAEKYGHGQLYRETEARLEGRVYRARKAKTTTGTKEEGTTVTETKPAKTRTPRKAAPAKPTTAPVAEEAPKTARPRKTAPKATESAKKAAPVVETTPAPAKPVATKVAARKTKAAAKAAVAPAADAPVVVQAARAGKGHKIVKPAAPALSLGDDQPLTEELMKARVRKGLCELCGKRRIGTGKVSGYESREYARSRKWCVPCGDESQHEIEHDNGHEGIPTDECWLCHPELNEAKKEHALKTGISKAGMVVYAKGDKAQVVADAVKAAKGESTHSTNKKGITVLIGQVKGLELKVVWNGRAHNWADSYFNGKHFKNIATLLRLIESA